jgi:hypothetical protein
MRVVGMISASFWLTSSQAIVEFRRLLFSDERLLEFRLQVYLVLVMRHCEIPWAYYGTTRSCQCVCIRWIGYHLQAWRYSMRGNKEALVIKSLGNHQSGRDNTRTLDSSHKRKLVSLGSVQGSILERVHIKRKTDSSTLQTTIDSNAHCTKTGTHPITVVD